MRHVLITVEALSTLMERHVCRSLEDSVLSAVGRFGEHALGITKAACNG